MTSHTYIGSTRRRGATPDPEREREVDLVLAVLSAVRLPHVTYTAAEIAKATGLSRGGVWYLERSALTKLARALERQGLVRVGAMNVRPGAYHQKRREHAA